MRFAGLVFILFFYLYVPEIIFLPVSLRLVFGVFGISLYLVRLINKYRNIKDDIQLNRDFFVFWTGTTALAFAALIVVVINGSGDIKVVRETIVRFSMLFGAAYFLTWYVKQFMPNSGYQIILKAFVVVVIIQCLIGIFSFAVPAVKQFLDAIQRPNEVAIQTKVGVLRMSGFGMTFFGAGLDCGVAMILIVHFIRRNTYSYWKLIGFALVFILIISVGTFMARTTIVGAMVALGYLMLPNSPSGKNLKFGLIVLTTLALLIGYSVPVLLNSEKYGMVIRFAFEAFFNYTEYGSLETESSNDLQTMYRFPEEFKTYLIGDGWLNHPEIEGYYYMQTDVGYLRLIYFGGIGYCLLWFIFHYLMLNRIVMNLNVKEVKWFALTLFAFLVIVNVKGLADFFPLVFLLLIFSTEFNATQTDKLNEKN